MKKLLAVCVCTFGLTLSESHAEDFLSQLQVGAAANLGYKLLSTDFSSNQPKNGFAYGLKALIEHRKLGQLTLGLNLGFEQSSLDGSDSMRSLTFSSEVYYLYRLGETGIEIGPVFNFQTGDGAQLSTGGAKQAQSLIALGGEIRHLVHSKEFDWFFGFEMLFSLNTAPASVWSFPFLAGITIPLDKIIGSRTEEMSKPREPAPEETVAKAAESPPTAQIEPLVATPTATPAPLATPIPSAPPAPSTLPANQNPGVVRTQLRGGQIQFEVYKTDLTPSAVKFVDQLAAALLSQKDNWKFIKIEGHTDGSGNEKQNLRLSEGRAKAVANELIKRGIPKKQISFKGYGSQHLIEGAALNAEIHRRVEVIYNGVADPIKLQDALESLKN